MIQSTVLGHVELFVSRVKLVTGLPLDRPVQHFDLELFIHFFRRNIAPWRRQVFLGTFPRVRFLQRSVPRAERQVKFVVDKIPRAGPAQHRAPHSWGRDQWDTLVSLMVVVPAHAVQVVF